MPLAGCESRAAEIGAWDPCHPKCPPLRCGRSPRARGRSASRFLGLRPASTCSCSASGTVTSCWTQTFGVKPASWRCRRPWRASESLGPRSLRFAPATIILRISALGPKRKFLGEVAESLVEHGCQEPDIGHARTSQGWAGASEGLVVDRSMDAGETIEFQGSALEAVPAPGHSPAQVCLDCSDQRVLFATGAILPRVTPTIGMHWFHRNDPLGDHVETRSVPS